MDDDTRIREPTEGPTVPLAVNRRAGEDDRAAWAPAAESLIAGRYRMGALLGAGGMGAVFRAERVALNEPVAIKFLHPSLAVDKDAIARFIREAQATSRIKNEHVVRILDVGATDNGLPFLVMDLLEGQDLGDVAHAGPLPITDAVDFVLQAAEALAEAHTLGIVHRDIKPANLWLARRSDGTPLVKVLDFGISKLAPAGGGDSKLTETSAVFGSPTYMSPEQIRSAKKVDALTDVWSLAVVLYELLTGRPPFEAETSGGVLASISADPPIPLLPRRPDAPPELERAILAGLEKDVKRRASLASLAAMLKPFASPAGAISADRVIRTGQPAPLLHDGSLRPPAPSSSNDLEAFARTEPAGGLHVPPAGNRSTTGPWIAVALVAAVLGMVALSSALWFRSKSSASREPEAPAVTESTPVPTVAPSQPAVAAPASSAPTIASLASASTTVQQVVPRGLPPGKGPRVAPLTTAANAPPRPAASPEASPLPAPPPTATDVPAHMVPTRK